MNDADFRTYFNRLESYFACKRAQAILLSPEEFELVEDLYNRKIPLDLVIRSIDLFFEKRSRRKRKSRRPVFLTHLKDDLEELIEEFNRKGMGSHRISGPTSDQFVSQRLADIAAQLEKASPSISEIAREALEGIQALEPRLPAMDMDELEEELERIANLAKARIFDTLDPDLVHEVEERVRDIIQRTGREMSPEILERFREEQIMRLLSFPVISLYR